MDGAANNPDRSRLHWPVRVGVGVVLALVSSRAAASFAEPVRAPVVEVAVVDDPSDIDERMATTLAAHFQTHGLAQEVKRTPVATPAELMQQGRGQMATRADQVASVWVHVKPATSEQPGVLRLYVYLQGADGLVGREVALPRGETAASLEAMANVATAVVAAIGEQARSQATAEDVAGTTKTPATEDVGEGGLVGEDLGLLPVSQTGELVERKPETPDRPATTAEQPANAATTEQKPPAAVSSRERPTEPREPRETSQAEVKGPPRLQLSLGYVGNTFARPIPWQSGLGLQVGFLLTPAAFIGLGYEVVVPSRVDALGVQTVLRRHPIIVEGGYRIGLGKGGHWDIGLGARLSLDPILRTARAMEMAPVMANQRSIRLFSSLGPQVSLGYSPVSPVRMSLCLGLDVLLSRAQYRAYTPAPTTLVDPHPLRFVAGFRLDFSMLRRPKKK